MSFLSYNLVNDWKEDLNSEATPTKFRSSAEAIVWEQFILKKYGLTLDEFAKAGLFKSMVIYSDILFKAGIYYDPYCINKGKDKFLSNDSLNTELIQEEVDAIYNLFDGETALAKEKEIFDRYFMTEELPRLSKLFSELNGPLHKFNVFRTSDNKLALYVTVTDIYYQCARTCLSSESGDEIVYNESLWPNHEEIKKKNRVVKDKVIKKSKFWQFRWVLGMRFRTPFLNYSRKFDYVIGRPKFFQYYMEKLSPSELELYKNMNWTVVYKIESINFDPCILYGRTKADIDIKINYDKPLDIN